MHTAVSKLLHEHMVGSKYMSSNSERTPKKTPSRTATSSSTSTPAKSKQTNPRERTVANNKRIRSPEYVTPPSSPQRAIYDIASPPQYYKKFIKEMNERNGQLSQVRPDRMQLLWKIGFDPRQRNIRSYLVPHPPASTSTERRTKRRLTSPTR